MTFEDLWTDVSDYVGYGRDLNRLSTEELSRVKASVKSGYIQFLRPTCREHLGYRWNFLSPQVNLSLVKDQEVYTLDLEYGAITGNIFYDKAGFAPIACDVGEANVVANRRENITGLPRMATVKIVKDVAEDGTWTIIKQLMVNPIPDQAYDVHFNVYLYTEELVSQDSFVFGADYYGETIKQACLASAELLINDKMVEHSRTFAAMLLASIEQDLQEAPTQWGNVGDKRNYSRPNRASHLTGGLEYDSMIIQGHDVF